MASRLARGDKPYRQERVGFRLRSPIQRAENDRQKSESRTALDTIFDADETFSSYDGIHGFGSLKIMADEVYKGRLEPFDCILALACFEHIEREEYKTIPLGQEQSH